MGNLKNETIQVLCEHGLNKQDIRWIGCREFRIDVDRFFELADREYDCSYGAPQVAEDLLIVGKDWWLERHEYDGSEWWEFKQLPLAPSHCITIDRLFARDIGWESLAKANNINSHKEVEA